MAKEKRSGNVNWGICTNTNGYDLDGEHHKCSKCENKEKQSIRVSKEFVCEECGEPLQKCKPPKPPISKGIIIAIVALLLIVGCVVAYFLLRGSNDTNPEDPVPVTLSLNKKAISLNVGDSDTLVVTVSPNDAGVVTAYKSDNDSIAVVSELGVVRALKEGTTMVVCYGTSNQGDTISDTCKIVVNQKEMLEPKDSTDLNTDTVKGSGTSRSVNTSKEKKNKTVSSNNGYGTYDLGWGVYNGPMKGGKPADGIWGEIKVTQTYSIDLKDGLGSTLEVRRGDVIVNTKFKDGKFMLQGELHRTDGTRRVL